MQKHKKPRKITKSAENANLPRIPIKVEVGGGREAPSICQRRWPVASAAATGLHDNSCEAPPPAELKQTDCADACYWLEERMRWRKMPSHHLL